MGGYKFLFLSAIPDLQQISASVLAKQMVTLAFNNLGRDRGSAGLMRRVCKGTFWTINLQHR